MCEGVTVPSPWSTGGSQLQLTEIRPGCGRGLGQLEFPGCPQDAPSCALLPPASFHWGLGTKPQVNIFPHRHPQLKTPYFFYVTVYARPSTCGPACAQWRTPVWILCPPTAKKRGWHYQKDMKGRLLAKNNSPILLHLRASGAQCFLKLQSSAMPGPDRSDALWKCYRKVILTLVEMGMKSLFKTTAIGERDQAHLQIQQRQQGFTYRSRWGASGWKITKRGHQGRKILAKLTE